MDGYDLTTDVWGIDPEGFPTKASLTERARYLLRYAILAPSSHNSQPWEFVVEDGKIEVHSNESRWLDVADQDKRELYISLGCAVENICIAAQRFGLDFEIGYHDDLPPVTVTLQPDRSNSSDGYPELFDQINRVERTEFGLLTYGGIGVRWTPDTVAYMTNRGSGIKIDRENAKSVVIGSQETSELLRVIEELH